MSNRGEGRVSEVTIAIAIAVASGLAGCHKLGQVVRGKPPTVAEARGSEACVANAEDPKPLVVDLPAEQRGDLEVAMKGGVPVVAFDCSAIRILEGCHAEGTYGFVGFSPKEELIRLDDKDDLHANLPFTAGALGAKLGGSLGRETSLGVALMMVGKRMSSARGISRTQLREDQPGACAKATHFVRGATIGAFVVETMAKGEAKTAAEIFGIGGLGKVGVGGGKSSEKSVHNADGSVDACKGADSSAEREPKGCGALLRLDLSAVRGAGEPKHPDAIAEDMKGDSPCPHGLVFTAGKCTQTGKQGPHLCRDQDAADCDAQCSAGDAPSCVRRGMMLMKDRTPANVGAAHDLFDKACRTNDPLGCGWLAEFHLAAHDYAAAYATWEKACGLGLSVSCAKLGIALYEGNRGSPKSPEKAPPWLKKGCDGGLGESCLRLAQIYMLGKLVPQDPPRARALFQRGCDGGSIVSCVQFAMTLGQGFGGNRDTKRAAEMFGGICDEQAAGEEHNIADARAGACLELARLLATGDGVPKDEARAQKLTARACSLGLREACKPGSR